MKVKIKLKDTTTPVYYEGVSSHFIEGPTLALLFDDGTVRNIPLVHIWYYETKQPRERTKVPSEAEQKDECWSPSSVYVPPRPPNDYEFHYPGYYEDCSMPYRIRKIDMDELMKIYNKKE